MSDQEVVDTLRANAARIISDGIPYGDLLFLEKNIPDAAQWCERWVALSHTYEDLAEQALANGAALTAGELLWRGALCCHFGQGIRMDVDPQAKRRADQRKNALFVRAAPMLSPPMERVSIPFEGGHLPGYLRLPKQAQEDPPPCVVVFGGLDTTKEDALEVSNHFVARGMAVLTFDGPGQGEMFHQLPLRVDFEVAVRAAIDYACTRPEIDPQRIGVLGRSTGGHWACATAGRDPRVKVAIAWGLIYHLRNFPSFSPSLKKRFMRSANNAATEQQAMDFFAPFDLDSVAGDIRCPVLVVQGGLDPIAPPDSADRLKAKAQGEVEVVVYPDSGHCAHDKTHLSKPLMADFAARRLMPGGA